MRPHHLPSLLCLLLGCSAGSADKADDDQDPPLEVDGGATKSEATGGGDAVDPDSEPTFDLDASPSCADLRCRRPVCPDHSRLT
ncbi:MAG: hypothetical protein HYV09_22380 [Deltaproteobacteria bacterium]|nr:hypothetical protein [Deltaproteobacteria bacterium]